ncbi:MAG: ABC transporter permease [Myxococcales bacterium]
MPEAQKRVADPDIFLPLRRWEPSSNAWRVRGMEFAPDRSGMDAFLLDLRLGLRSLRRNAAFSAAALFTLALGIGGTCAIFGVLNAVFLRPLPFQDEARLVRLRDFTAATGGAISPVNISGRHFVEIAAEAKTLSGASAQRGRSAVLTGGENPERIEAVLLSPGSLDVLGVRPAMGRGFLPGEEDQGEDSGAALISTALWRSRFGADPGVIGRTLRLDGRTLRIVGVLPVGFRFPYHADVWLPGRVDPASPDDYAVFARLTEGMTLERSQAELAAIASHMRERDARTYPGYGILATPLRESLVGDQDRVALALLVVLGLFLLLACVDVAMLLLARSVGREHEFAVRSALGASPWRQIRQLLTETALLALVGGALGVVLAWEFGPALWGLVPSNLSEQLGLVEAPFDPRVLAFALSVSLGSALLAGALPALQASRPDLEALLRGATSGTDPGSRRRLMAGFVALQIAVAAVLLSGAGLVIENFRLLRGTGLGFDERQLLTAEVELPRVRYADGARRIVLVEQLASRLAAIPGVAAAGVITMNPLRGATWSAPLVAEGQEELQAASVYHRLVTPGLLGTLRIPLLGGRDFGTLDGPDAQPVCIVSARLAARLWPGQDALGKRVRLAREASPWRTVVGVAGDLRERFDVREAWYLPYAQNASSPAAEVLELMARSAAAPDALAASLRRAVADVDPGLAVAEVATMERVRVETLAQERLGAQTVSLFAVLGLALAAVGTYGVLGYAVARRSRELAIRVALGATPGALIRMVMRHGLLLALTGVGTGVLAAVSLHRLVASQLSEVARADPRIYAGVAALLLVVASAATWLPARRAVKVDPALALRAE